MADKCLHVRTGGQRSRDQDSDVYSERGGDSVIELKTEWIDLETGEKVTQEDIEKGCRPATNKRASQRRRTNVLRRYINRIRTLCLLNALAAIVLAVIYTETKNESIFCAMAVCNVNAMIAWFFT